MDFEFVLFASALIDYDYIMNLVADSTQQKPTKHKMTKAQIISLLKSNSNLMDEEEDLTNTSMSWIGIVDKMLKHFVKDTILLKTISTIKSWQP